jgi:surface polysaccharide O-acyltransferase-like enzyme
VEDNTAWVIVDSFFPVLNNAYWYFTAYFCLFFFMPLINYAVLYAPRRAVECSICAVVLLFGFANSIGEKSVFSLSNGYSVIWIGCMYLVGAYLKKYDPLKNFNWWKSLVAFIICVILAFLSKRLIESYAVNERYQLSKHAFLFYPSPFIFFEALFLFNLFQHLRLKGGFSKVVSVLSPLTFGVFLVHDNPIIRNKFISEKFAHYVDYPIAKMLFMIFLTALVIFLICILIDFIRSQLFKLIKVKSFSRWLSDKISKLTDFVFNRKDKKEEQVVFLNDNEKEKEEYEKSSGNIE